MPVVATSSNYSGRQVDLSIFPDQRLPNRAVITDIGKDRVFSRAIAGPAKASQNYGRLLLTPLGSVRSHPTMGTKFRERFTQGGLRYGTDPGQVFAAENLRVLDFLDSVSVGRPDDERIESATLQGFTVVAGGVTLNVALTMRSGDTTTFLLPVSWSL